MKLEAIRLNALAAADPTIGVNAMLAALTLMPGDARPDPVTIYNAVDHGWVARRTVPEDGAGVTYPALAVLLVKPAQFDEVPSNVRDGHIPIGFIYLQKASDTSKGLRDAFYTELAILRFLARLESPAGDALRVTGDVGLVYPDATESPLYEATWGSALAVSATVVTWVVRDDRANPSA